MMQFLRPFARAGMSASSQDRDRALDVVDDRPIEKQPAPPHRRGARCEASDVIGERCAEIDVLTFLGCPTRT